MTNCKLKSPQDNAEKLLDEGDFETQSDEERKIWTASQLVSLPGEPDGAEDRACPNWFQGLTLVGRANYHSPSHVVPPEVFARHYELIFVEKGRQLHWLDSKPQLLESGDCLLISPLQKHSTAQQAEERGRFYWWIFAPDDGLLSLNTERSTNLLQALCRHFEPQARCATRRLSAKVAGQLKDALTALFADWGTCLGRSAGISSAISSWQQQQYLLDWEHRLLHLFFIVLQDCPAVESVNRTADRAEGAGGNNPYLQTICHYIQRRLRSKISLQELRRLTPYSEAHLLRLFRQEFGLPPRDYINYQRILLAQELLLAGQSVTDVALALSFSSSQYFTVVFRRYVGQSPTEWWRQNKGRRQ